MLVPCLLALVASTLAVPIDEKRAAGPSVTIKQGTVVGSSVVGVDSFRGIPFAQPPVGSLRLKPPQPFTGTFGTLAATGIPTACEFPLSRMRKFSGPREDTVSV